jgi:hypothetical protein
MTTNVIRSSFVKVLRTLKKSPFLVSIKRSVWGKYSAFRQKYFDFDRFNVCNTFPLFTPHSGGSYRDRARLTILAINQTIPLLSSFATSVSQDQQHNVISIKAFPVSNEDLEAARELKQYFDKYGSDKGSNDYHHVYGPILRNRDEITGILEIGMGTNNTDVVSNMGLWGDVTGVFCTSGSEREFTLEGSWYADEEIQAGADRDTAAPS